MIKHVVAIGSLLAIVACGQVNEQQTSSLDASSQSKNKITLAPGRYLVNASALEMCSPGLVTLKQEIELGSFAGKKLDHVTLSKETRITDNFIRPAVCRMGTIKGTASLNLTKSTIVELKGFAFESVEKIAAVSDATTEVRNGRYLVSVTRPDMCANRLINISQSLEFDVRAISRTIDTVTLSSNSFIATNEITTLECKSASTDSGETVVTVNNGDASSTSKIIGKGLTIASVLKIERTTPVALTK